MFASAIATSPKHALPIALMQVVGITAPAIYSSLTFAYSYIVVPPIVNHAPPRVLAKQWLQAYQYAANFVPPLVITGTASNLLLAYLVPRVPSKLLYGFAAGMVFSIIPVTLFFFEPTVNGAGKWKVQKMLQDEGYHMKEQTGALPSPFVHTAKPKAREWAEGVEMKEIAATWARLNAGRYVITAFATMVSAVATCNWDGALV